PPPGPPNHARRWRQAGVKARRGALPPYETPQTIFLRAPARQSRTSPCLDPRLRRSHVQAQRWWARRIHECRLVTPPALEAVLVSEAGSARRRKPALPRSSPGSDPLRGRRVAHGRHAVAAPVASPPGPAPGHARHAPGGLAQRPAGAQVSGAMVARSRAPEAEEVHPARACHGSGPARLLRRAAVEVAAAAQ